MINISYEVYGKVDCIFCKKAVDLLTKRNLPFIFIVMDKNPSFMEDIKRNNNHLTVPLIFETGFKSEFDSFSTKNFIGGFTELEIHLSNNNTEMIKHE